MGDSVLLPIMLVIIAFGLIFMALRGNQDDTHPKQDTSKGAGWQILGTQTRSKKKEHSAAVNASPTKSKYQEVIDEVLKTGAPIESPEEVIKRASPELRERLGNIVLGPELQSFVAQIASMQGEAIAKSWETKIAMTIIIEKAKAKSHEVVARLGVAYETLDHLKKLAELSGTNIPEEQWDRVKKMLLANSAGQLLQQQPGAGNLEAMLQQSLLSATVEQPKRPRPRTLSRPGSDSRSDLPDWLADIDVDGYERQNERDRF
jgi:hypothetical protein